MPIDPQKIPELIQEHGSLRAIARALGVDRKCVHRAKERAIELGVMKDVRVGVAARQSQNTKVRVKALKARRIHHQAFVLTDAQNNTEVHSKTWDSLRTLADDLGAKLLVSTCLYDRNSPMHRSRDKSILSGRPSQRTGIWYDDKIVPYICNERVELAKGLVFCGELNINPTAERPLRGLEVYTGRASMIVPHTRLHMQSIATLGGSGAKLNYSTGAVTLRNYIQRKEGFKAEFHHAYGGLLVETDNEGRWWTRQLLADSDGVIHDLDRKVADGKITTGNRVEGITFGDIHEDDIDPIVRDATWGAEGMVDVLNPRFQFFHDLINFGCRGHHDIKNPYKMFKRFAQQRDSVERELQGAARFLEWTSRKDCQGVVVPSNHERHLSRWLADNDGRRDPINAEIWSKLNAAAIAYIASNKEEPNYLALALATLGYDGRWLDDHNVAVLDEGTSFVICPKNGGGIECAMHFDLGPNGMRGTLGAFARMGRRANGGHSHSAGWIDGACQAGTKSRLRLGYNNAAPSSWTHTDIITHENSKRQLVTFFDGKWRA